MKRRIENWSVERLYDERSHLIFPEYQREKRLWTEDKKSLLIDSILQDIDIPKLYFNVLKRDAIEVVDGQQRLWTIWDFIDDVYPYTSGGNRSRFSDFTADQARRFKSYTFQVTRFEDADDDYLRELFVRLQLGLLLKPGEKLNAAKGKMKEFVFDKLAKTPFMQHLGIPNRRYALETLCAQISINAFSWAKNGSYARTRYDDLLHFFSTYESPRGKDLELYQKCTQKILLVLDQLWKCFGATGARVLRNRSFVLSIYLYVEELLDGKSSLSSEDQKAIRLFSAELWASLKEEMRLGMRRKNEEIYVFQTLLSSAPGEEYQIRRRAEKLDEFYKYFKKTGKIKGE